MEILQGYHKEQIYEVDMAEFYEQEMVNTMELMNLILLMRTYFQMVAHE